MKIKFDRTKEQLELVQAMASKDRELAFKAQQAMATFISPILAEVIQTAEVLGGLYETLPYSPDENPSFPLDLFSDVTDVDFLKVYSQSVPGGLPSNEVLVPSAEMKMHTYSLDSAWSFDSKYARRSRLDIVAKTFMRMMQEILYKQETQSANVLLGTLADNAQDSDANPTTNPLVQAAGTKVQVADFNKMVVRAKRINSSWTKGTPEGRVGGITDILLSPERMGDLREMAYNSINNLDSDKSVASGVDSGLAAPDSIRERLFNGAGLAEFYGFVLNEINELGKGQRFTNVFGSAYSGTFTPESDDLLIGIDATRDSLYRGVSTDPDSNSSVTVEVDDQFYARQKRIGWYLDVEEGRVCLDWRVVMGLRVANAAS